MEMPCTSFGVCAIDRDVAIAYVSIDRAVAAPRHGPVNRTKMAGKRFVKFKGHQLSYSKDVGAHIYSQAKPKDSPSTGDGW